MSDPKLLVYFVEKRPPELERVVRGLFEVAGPDSELRTMFAAEAGAEFVRFKDGKPMCDKKVADNRPERNNMGYDASVEEFVGVCMRHPWASVKVMSDREELLWESIRQKIPTDISGKSAPSHFEIIIGTHDWTEKAPTARGLSPCVYYGRSEVAFILGGFKDPPNPTVYWDMLLKMPEFIQLQRDIERVLGPVKRCISWSF